MGENYVSKIVVSIREVSLIVMIDKISTNKLYSFQDIAHILFCRETLFSSVNKRPYLRTAMNLTSRNSQLYEVKALRESFKISRDFEGSQESLKAAMSLSKQVEPSAALGLNIEAAAKFDVANVLWDQGEMATSIRMLQQLNEQCGLHKQTLAVSRAEVLASLVNIIFIHFYFTVFGCFHVLC